MTTFDDWDIAEMSKSSTYAKAVGSASGTDNAIILGNAPWWLRTTVSNPSGVLIVDDKGSYHSDYVSEQFYK